MILQRSIRLFIFLSFMFISFLIDYLVKKITYLFDEKESVHIDNIEAVNAIERSKLILQNGHFLTKQSFLMRKHFFNNNKNGYFCSNDALVEKENVTMGLEGLKSGLKSYILIALPVILMMELCDKLCSGYILLKLPFIMSRSFKQLLQKDLNLPELDGSWVSSISLYCKCLTEIKNLENKHFQSENMNTIETFDSKILKNVMKKKWEELEIYNHHFKIQNARHIFIKSQLL
uniref:ER membrane protein complex subunit 3 n=1 Tax=Clastoptera arizonana TaxID=38151 RepID=A0A1B6EDF5_9HEMI